MPAVIDEYEYICVGTSSREWSVKESVISNRISRKALSWSFSSILSSLIVKTRLQINKFTRRNLSVA